MGFPARRVWLLAALLTLCLAAFTPVQSHLAAIERSTIQLRGLQPVRPVRVSFLRDQAFDAVVRRETLRTYSDSDTEIGRREMVLLGLLGPTVNLRRIYLQDLSTQVIGLYSPQDGALYVRSDDNNALGWERDTIVHEYTHALQDQHFNLRKLLPDVRGQSYRNTDALDARHALTEGDAVNTQLLYVYSQYSAADLRAWTARQLSPAPGPALPPVIQREFDFPYTDGYYFVQALYHRGGMRAVDAAYARLPSSTYEIMFPQAYLHGWRPVTVTMHTVAGMEGWQQRDDDVLGAIGYKVLFWQFLGEKVADRVVEGYRGDRYIFWERGGKNAMRLDSTWASPHACAVARQAVFRIMQDRFRTVYTAGVVLRERAGAVGLTCAGAHLTVSYAPTVALADRLVRAAVR